MKPEKNNLTFDDKIAVLQQMHRKSAPDARKQISDWNDEMERLTVTADWLEHPNTAELRELASGQIEAITTVLANDENLAEADRKALFAAKKAHLAYLAVLTYDPTPEIEAVEDKVNFEL